jgi:hypothetical protein
MAYSKSGWFTDTLLAVLTSVSQTGTPSGVISLTGSTTDNNTYLSLVSSSATDYSSPVATGSSSPAWANTDEITGTGWATGGVELGTAASGSSVTTTLTQTGSGPYALTYSWTNPLSVTGTTLTGVYGFITYFKNISAPVSKPELLTIYVGTGYNTVAGTFGITPSGTGLSVLTLTA